MKTKLLATYVFILLASVCLISVSTTFAAVGEGDWITKYRVEDLDTGQVIMERDFATGSASDFGAIVEGAELKVSVTVEVGLNNPTATLKLSTSMSHATSEDRYWQ